MQTGMTGSINTNALMKASGIGLAVTFVMTLIGTGSGLAIQSLAKSGDQSSALAMVSVLGIVAVCACCFGYLAYAGVGALYAYFVGQAGEPLDTGKMALGGALSAVIVGILTGICSSVLSLVTNVSQFSALNSLGGSSGSGAAAAGIAGGVIGVFIGLCIVLVLSGGFGAAGGAIYAAVRGNRAPKPAM